MRANGCCLMTLRCVCSRRRISCEPAPLRRSPHLHLTCCSTGGCSTQDTNMNSRTAVDSGGCSNQALWQLSTKTEDSFWFVMFFFPPIHQCQKYYDWYIGTWTDDTFHPGNLHCNSLLSLRAKSCSDLTHHARTETGIRSMSGRPETFLGGCDSPLLNRGLSFLSSLDTGFDTFLVIILKMPCFRCFLSYWFCMIPFTNWRSTFQLKFVYMHSSEMFFLTDYFSTILQFAFTGDCQCC